MDKRLNPKMNNVRRIFNKIGWKPAFIDPMTNGYRVNLGPWSFSNAIQYFQNSGIDVKKEKLEFRIRGGYGHKSGTVDVIVPYSNAKKATAWKVR